MFAAAKNGHAGELRHDGPICREHARDRDERRVRIDGLDVLGDGATRDFTYVDDVIDVLLGADRVAGKTLNVGTGKETLMDLLARQIVALFGLDESIIRVKPARNWDTVVRRVADVTALRESFPGCCSTNIDYALPRAAAWLHRQGFVRRKPS